MSKQPLALSSSGTDRWCWLFAGASWLIPTRPTTRSRRPLWFCCDAAKADQALWAFVRAGGQGLTFLQARLRPAKAADAKQVAALLEGLDSKDVAQREQAARALEELGETVEKALRDALAGTPNLEVRRRIEHLLEKRDAAILRGLRAIEAVEHHGTGAAREVLATLSRDTPNPRMAEAARSALGRLKKE